MEKRKRYEIGDKLFVISAKKAFVVRGYLYDEYYDFGKKEDGTQVCGLIDCDDYKLLKPSLWERTKNLLNKIKGCFD